jgi:hypothetical protein
MLARANSFRPDLSIETILQHIFTGSPSIVQQSTRLPYKILSKTFDWGMRSQMDEFFDLCGVESNGF